MKVFEVLCEYTKDDDPKVITERQYVTAYDNQLKTVVDHFTAHCEEYEKDLIGVKEVLTIVQQLEPHNRLWPKETK
jgi:hypothetical protein